MLNKNLIRRRMSIFLLLTLYIGFCLEAAAFPPEVMAVGELHELEEGYWIEVVKADVEMGEALFALHKEGRPPNEASVISGERFSLDDGDIFHFEAKLDAVFRSEDAIMVELTDYEWWLEVPAPAPALPPEIVMTKYEFVMLDGVYGIEVGEADVEEGIAFFALYKEGVWIDEASVSSGELFSLDDGNIFHFEATLNAVFRSEGAIMVELTDYDYGPREVTPTPPEPTPEPRPPIIGTSETTALQILIISAGIIVLFFIILTRQQKKGGEIPETKKGIELLEKKPEMIPDLSVNRTTSEISITEGEELDVTIELKNNGSDVAKSVSLSDRIPDGFKIISGDKFWTGDIKQGESKSIEYKIKADKAGKYTIPLLTVEYEDKRGKLYEKSIKAIKIEVIPEVTLVPKNAYGVVIGIGKYQDEGIPTLKYAREDALEIYNILTDIKYGNFPHENVKLLLDEQATLTEIKSAMGTFLARNAGEDDMVCIYYAGHGSPEIDPTGNADDKLEKFIVPYNAKKDDLFGYGLSMDTIRKILDERIKSKRAVFFIDSCYSGEAGGRTFSKSDILARNITISEKFLDQLSGEGRIIITASKPDELSLETDELRHGIFTYYLAEGLKGKADLNEDGVVTVDELYSYVYEQVTKKARQLGGGQHPLKKGTIVGKIPLTRYETEEMMRIKELNLNASRLFEEDKHEEALVIWGEVLKIDEGNAEALAGIRKSKKKIEEVEAILTEKQRRLLELHKKGLPAKEYDEAMILLKKNPQTYTELERNIVEYIEKLLNGDISIGVYVDTLKLIK